MEIWKEVKGYEGLYQVSNFGRLKSFRVKIEKILKCSIDSNGYLKLGVKKKASTDTLYIHQLVAIAFLGHRPCGHELVVDHIDNNPLNNNLSNLQVITTRANCSKDRVGLSNYPGVYWCKHTSKWRAQITIDRKRKCLGRHMSEHDAYLAYEKALSKM